MADERFGGAGFLRKAMKHVFPDHWSFLLGEVALYSFIILILSGIFLTLFFKPSLGDVVYHGSYHPLDGMHMSEAYESTLDITFDVRGGLLMRQIHHWAANLFVAAIAIHMLRIFFTGAFRKPREANWVIGVTMFALAAGEGFLGYSMPDDALSGTGVRIAEGVLLSIPVVGTYITFFLFGGPYPGYAFIGRFYILHVLLIPGLLLALVTAHLMIIWHQGHTQWPGKNRRDNTEVGEPLYPIFMIKTGALFFFTFAALAIAATFAQINPIWLYGPYNPATDSANSQPDWYIGFMEGALRLTPNVITNIGGHTFAWNVFIPAVLLPFGFFLMSGLYPFFEQLVTGDRRWHQVLDRPRNEPTRTAIGAAVVAMGADLQLAGADDVIAFKFHMNIWMVAWVLRVGFFVLPVIAFFVARYTALALQRRDRRALAQGGVATGEIASAPDSDFAAVTRPLTEDELAVLKTRRPQQIISPIPRHVIPLPTPKRINAQVKARLNRFYTGHRLETPSSYGQPGEPDGQSPGSEGPDGHAPEGAAGRGRRRGAPRPARWTATPTAGRQPGTRRTARTAGRRTATRKASYGAPAGSGRALQTRRGGG
jgi:ubiquinol-cytochrome c reductase cytochrome b subunit